MSTHVTLKAIAEQLGVTHGTVSRALQGDARVKPATAERVRELAQQLGYTPSRLGRALRGQRSGTLGILVASLADPFYAAVIEGASQALQRADYGLLLAPAGVTLESQTQAVRVLEEHRVDGLLVHVPTVSELFQRLLRPSAIPAVLINNHHQHEWPLSVSNDDLNGARECTELLVRSGFRRIGYLSCPSGGSPDLVRESGYREVLAAAGLRPEVRQASGPNIPAGLEAVEGWLPDLPEALFCYNDVLAVGAIRACLQAGLRLPDDLALVGFDDIDLAGFVTPSLTTYAQPRHLLGSQAAEMMLAHLQQPELARDPLVLQGRLIVRESSLSVRVRRPEERSTQCSSTS